MVNIMDDSKAMEKKPNYETTDAQIRPLIYAGVVILVLMFGHLSGLFPYLKFLNTINLCLMMRLHRWLINALETTNQGCKLILPDKSMNLLIERMKF